MKYDDASWHYGGDFPQDLPQEAGSIHIGMFVTWAMLNGIGGKFHEDESPDLLEMLRTREISPGEFIRLACDEIFTEEDLSDEGNVFAAKYYDPQTGKYIDHYSEVLGESAPSIYHADDSWEYYDRLAPLIQGAYSKWKAKVESPWWKFWHRASRKDTK